MASQNRSRQLFTSAVLFSIVLKYRKPLVIIAILAVVLSSIFSGPNFITPLYKSEVILYPTASNSISKVLLSNNFNNSKDILEFGEDEQTEQMLQVLNSNKIRDRVIEKYDLMKHYKIKPDEKYRYTKLYKRYEDNFRFRRTEFMAVQITVFDSDAQMASDMANDIARLLDSTINKMQKKVAVKAFNIVEQEYLKQKNEIRAKEDSLTKLRELGVHDYESQAEMFNRQLAIEMAKGNAAGVKRLQKKLDALALYGGAYVSLRDALEHDKKQLSELKAKYEEAKVDAEENLPHTFIVSDAYKSEKKAYPIRWLIVVISTLSALLLAIVVLGVIDFYQSGAFDVNPKKKSKRVVGTIGVVEDAVNEARPVKEEKRNSKERAETIVDDIAVQVKKKKKESIKRDKVNKTEMNNLLNSSDLLRLIDKWKVHLSVIVVVSVILGMIFSGPTFITPLYKSYAVAYPANIDSYSEESNTEQMLQILNSQDITDKMLEEFDLGNHYNIDKSYKYYRTALLNQYHDKVNISKTPYESVMIEVLDHDPEVAKKMVDRILTLYDWKVASLHKSKYAEVVKMYKQGLARKRHDIDSLENLLAYLGTEKGVFEYQQQSREITEGYLGTTGGSASGVNKKEAKRLFKNMGQYGGKVLELAEMIRDEANVYAETKKDMELAERFLYSHMTYSNIITHPAVADKKSYPIRWLVVVIVALAAFVFALFTIFFIENRKSNKA